MEIDKQKLDKYLTRSPEPDRCEKCNEDLESVEYAYCCEKCFNQLQKKVERLDEIIMEISKIISKKWL